MAVTFLQAKDDEALRQEYLDSFLVAHPSDNVSVLSYNLHKKAGLDRVTELAMAGNIDIMTADSLRRVVYESTSLAFLILTSDIIGRGYRHPIIVNPEAFNDLTVGEFTYYLEDHEYFHAIDFRYGILLSDGTIVDHTNAARLKKETMESLVETRALFHQLKRGVTKGLAQTEAFMDTIHGFLGYHDMLMNVVAQNEFERRVIDSQIRSYQGMLPAHLRT